MQRTTLKHIAELAGVSKTTVSLILNNKAKQNRISHSTLLKVKDVMDKNDFIINNQAKCFRMNKSFTIGIVVPDLENPFFAKLVSNIEKAGKERNYLFIVGTSDDEPQKEDAVINRFLQHAVDGLMIVSSTEKPSRNLPDYVSTVYVDRKVQLRESPTIVTNHKEAASMMADFLLQKSFTNILFLNGEQSLVTSKERLIGFKESFKKSGVDLPESKIIHGKHSKESGYQMIRKAWAEANQPIECIYTTSWSIMEGVLEFLKSLKTIPTSLVLATFDHHAVLDYFPLRSVSVQQDTFSLATNSFSALYGIMNKKPFRLQQEISAQLITKNFFK